MSARATTGIGLGIFLCVAATAAASGAAETWTATATVKTAAGAEATAPVTIVVDRTLTAAESEKLIGVLKTGGGPALHKALAGVPPTGSVRVGKNAPVTTRLTLERRTDKGRLLTIVTDAPLLFLGASLPGAKAKEGYDFAVIDIEVDDAGNGSGTLAPAAKIRVSGTSVVVSDYGTEAVRLVNVKRAK